MNRAGVSRFLETVSERDLDRPLLALLHLEGYFDIHLTHGTAEFGKDFIAKKVVNGEIRQFALQSKAGNLSQSGWRDVRPQLVEAFENDLSHPDFDETLPRTVVLIFSGRFTGNASLEAQQFKAKYATGGREFLVWDLDWLINEFSDALGLLAGEAPGGSTLVWNQIAALDGDREVEMRTRSWIDFDANHRAVAIIDCALTCSSYASAHRSDLASLAAIGLVRASLRWRGPAEDALIARDAGLAAFSLYASEVVESFTSVTDDQFAAASVSLLPSVTYPAMALRVGELASVLLLLQLPLSVSRIAPSNDILQVLSRLEERQPGIRRPISDEHGVSIAAIAIAMCQLDIDSAYRYVVDVSQWLLDRYDPDQSGLGIAGLDESRESVAARLIGGAFDSSPERRQSSYLATVVLDLCIYLGARNLYETLLDNLAAIQVTPCLTSADEQKAAWRRGGDHVWPDPNPGFNRANMSRTHRGNEPIESPGLSILVSLLTRSRHYPEHWPQIETGRHPEG